jgi:arginyl-tRNA synthetase
MATVLWQLERHFRQAIREALGVDAEPLLSPSQNEKFGDYQSNAAMGLAKAQKANPRAVATQIVAKLKLGQIATEEPTIAGPGFINIRLSPGWLAGQLQAIEHDPRLGIEVTTTPQTVVIDYSGPNIAKEMHVGHLRSTIIGDAISRVTEFEGHNVIRQNHIGDWGTQFGMLIAERQNQAQQDPASTQIADLEEFYRKAKARFDADPAFAARAREAVVTLQSGDVASRAVWQGIVDETRRHYQPLYERLGVMLRTEHERGESFYNAYLPSVVEELESKGIAGESEGAIVVQAPGFESPLIIQKSDGGFLYGTTDLAGVRYRTQQLHADRIIYTHDSRQAQHFAQVFWAANQASWTRHGAVKLEYAPFGTMLGEDGKPFKSRSGELVKLKELLDEAEDRALKVVTEKNPQLPEAQRRQVAHAIGIGAVKYADLSKDRISDYMFSWDKMLAFDGNTAPYLQNAYVRVHGIFRKARAMGIEAALDYSAIRLQSPFELALAKHVLRIGDAIDAVARDLKPHILCTYLFELATRYHSFFENCPVLQSEAETRKSRLALCDVTARTLALGLELLGIEHPEQM